MRLHQLFEAKTDNVTVVYGGRFQPMHQGHFALYKRLQSRFGADNVFIATTFGQKQQAMHKAGDYSTDPFTFAEKQDIMNRMFGIDKSQILDTSPYQPDISKAGRDDTKTALILAFSAKDAQRLKSGGYLRPLPENPPYQTMDEVGYIIEMPIEQGGMSATDFRKAMATGTPEEKEKVFNAFFGKMDKQVFKFIEDRLKGK